MSSRKLHVRILDLSSRADPWALVQYASPIPSSSPIPNPDAEKGRPTWNVRTRPLHHHHPDYPHPDRQAPRESNRLRSFNPLVDCREQSRYYRHERPDSCALNQVLQRAIESRWHRKPNPWNRISDRDRVPLRPADVEDGQEQRMREVGEHERHGRRKHRRPCEQGRQQQHRVYSGERYHEEDRGGNYARIGHGLFFFWWFNNNKRIQQQKATNLRRSKNDTRTILDVTMSPERLQHILGGFSG